VGGRADGLPLDTPGHLLSDLHILYNCTYNTEKVKGEKTRAVGPCPRGLVGKHPGDQYKHQPDSACRRQLACLISAAKRNHNRRHEKQRIIIIGSGEAERRKHVVILAADEKARLDCSDEGLPLLVMESEGVGSRLRREF